MILYQKNNLKYIMPSVWVCLHYDYDNIIIGQQLSLLCHDHCSQFNINFLTSEYGLSFSPTRCTVV